jgi:hypothetical protein
MDNQKEYADSKEKCLNLFMISKIGKILGFTDLSFK